MEFKIDNNKNIIIKAILYITKSGQEITRKINLVFNGAEFERCFYTKKQLKEFVNFLKYYNIPITLIKTNCNCSYMDLPF